MTRSLHDISSTTHHVVRGGLPLVGWSRLPIIGTSVLFATAFAIAVWLRPDPSGFGTHQQLGFPPCTIYTYFKIPCPTCGMTTSFAHFVRGEWIDAARANTGCLILACFGALYLPWSIVSLTRKEYWKIEQPSLWFFGILCGWMLITIIEWTVRDLVPWFLARMS